MDYDSARRLLEVSASASAPEVERAYRRKALRAHPDRGGQTEAFLRLARARAVVLGEAVGTSPSGRREPLLVIHTQPLLRRLLDVLIASCTPAAVREARERARPRRVH